MLTWPVGDHGVVAMERIDEGDKPLAWLLDRPPEEAATGYDAAGWECSTWVLHAMYRCADLAGLGSSDERHRQRVASGDVEPLIIGTVDVDQATTDTGVPLGFVSRPPDRWRRVLWSDYLAGLPGPARERTCPPSHCWFPHDSWPIAIAPPPEGSLDEASLHCLLETLSRHSAAGAGTEVFAFFASLPAGDFDSPHLWHGPLDEVPTLIDGYGGPYAFSPSNLWPADRSWFVLTDYDLQGTKVSGSTELVEAVRSHPGLETAEWPTHRGGPPLPASAA